MVHFEFSRYGHIYSFSRVLESAEDQWGTEHTFSRREQGLLSQRVTTTLHRRTIGSS